MTANAPAPASADSRRHLVWITPLVVTAVVTAAYVFYAAWQWNQVVVKSWDLSIFTQLLQSYAQFQPPIVNIKGDGFNLLGDHFHPLLVLLTPVFAVFPHAFTLLVVQAVCFGVSAGMFTAVASRQLGTRAGGALLGVAFGLSWGLQYAAEVQFHEIALAVPLLTGTLGAVLEHRWQAAMLWAAPLVFVKEDLGLTVMVIGLLIAYLSRSPRALWLAAWGLGWFAITTLLVLPALNPDGTWAYAANANPAGLLADPASFFDPAKGHTLALLLTTTAGFVLRSPLALVLVPTLAWRFLSTNNGYWGPTWHYSAVLMPIAFAVLVDGIQRASSSRWAWLRSYARYAAAVAITVAAMLLPHLPLAILFTPGAWAAPDRAEAAATILASIPDGASVETDIGLMSYLVDDHDVYWIGNTNPAADCILIDRAGGGTPGEWGDVLGVARRLHETVDYTFIKGAGDYELACIGTSR
ncbi:MAG: DUF2079 domain-containing protein [Microbacterium sp.]